LRNGLYAHNKRAPEQGCSAFGPTLTGTSRVAGSQHTVQARYDRISLDNDGQDVQLQPFCGTMGVATDAEGPLDVLPPTKGAGNIDTRHLNVGAKLYLPVYVPGALFSAGDCHAAQGDGEVCVTGIECPMRFTLRFNVVKGRSLPPWRYQFVTPPGPLQPRYDAKGYFVNTALGPDLMTDAKNAVRGLIDWLVAEKDLSREDAYILCSLAADLKISQIVDQPNWGVSAYLALSVFAG